MLIFENRRKDKGRRCPQNPSEDDPLLFSQCRNDVQAGYRRGVDIQKGGGERGKKDDDQGRRQPTRTSTGAPSPPPKDQSIEWPGRQPDPRRTSTRRWRNNPSMFPRSLTSNRWQSVNSPRPGEATEIGMAITRSIPIMKGKLLLPGNPGQHRPAVVLKNHGGHGHTQNKQRSHGNALQPLPEPVSHEGPQGCDHPGEDDPQGWGLKIRRIWKWHPPPRRR